jgi:hypothetical protein
MNLQTRIESFSSLGRILRAALRGNATEYTSQLEYLIRTQHLKNPWFTPENVKMAITAIANELTAEKLQKWTLAYPMLKNDNASYRVAVIMAGNIPLAGFHDFLSVLISGNNIVTKTSAKDPDLILFLRDVLCFINPGFIKKIEIAEANLSGFDAVIATGSDNTSRYFEHYFGKVPHIIRKHRNSIGILMGDETDQELEDLGKDIFSYFGLGCRNISKLYLPRGYNLSRLTERWKSYAGLISHSKYANNYDFNKAVFLVNKENFTDTGFLLIKENKELSSPVAVLNFEYFSSVEHLRNTLEILSEKIQCVVGRDYIPFGSAQSPALWDYADGTDTLEFLLKKYIAGIL